MLSQDKRQHIEREGVREIQRFHREIQPTTFAGIVDDIRHKVIEEGWFGRQVTGDIGRASMGHDVTHERGSETSDYTALYGSAPVGWGVVGEPDGGHDIHGNPMEPEPAQKKAPEAGL